jgi:UDP-N-acetylmuramate--alanine ligase
MPGLHNLSNAMAAIAACRLEGLTFNQIEKGLTDLQPPGRRFDFRGSWKGRHVVDDYAHHPSEVRATLSMARLMISSGRSPLPSPPQRLVTVFQPHRYSRTAEFLSDFAIALKTSDVVLLAPVYSAGEQPIEGTNSERLAAEIRKLDTNLPIAVAESIDQLCILLETYSRKGDLVLAMGAGDVNSLWGRLINQNNNRWLSTLAA